MTNVYLLESNIHADQKNTELAEAGMLTESRDLNRVFRHATAVATLQKNDFPLVFQGNT